jgi:dipeptidyl aminopeptidase/acylaminoacyl peptidase
VLAAAGGAFAIRDRGADGPNIATIGPRSTSTNPSPPADTIAFTRDYTIVAIRPSATSAPRPLTTSGCCSVSAWSPDHTLLAVNDHTDIAIVRADGTVVRRLDASTVFAPAWSPDGRQIAFSASPAGGSNGGPIRIVSTDGKHAARTVANVFAGRVAWSPDGTRIAFTSLDEPLHVDVLTLATGKVTRLTNGPGTEQWDPSWSAATGRIVFASTAGIYDVDGNGRGRHELVAAQRPCCNVASPSWSPDGTKVVYDVAVTGSQELIVVDVATRKQIQLSSGADGGTSPAW